MGKEKMSLEELEALVGRKHLSQLFMEHYMTVAGSVFVDEDVVDGLGLDDIME